MSQAVDAERLFRAAGAKGHCESCGRLLTDGAYRLPLRAAWFCGVACIETDLVGGPHCRWCGGRMEKPYTSLDSRLCSEGCAESYHAHVLGDRTAILGSGKRLRLWLARNAPAHAELEGRRCANPKCRKDEKRYPATIDHLRAGTLYCSESCKKQAHRSPNRHNPGPKPPVFIEFSRDTLPGKAFGINPGIPAPQTPFLAVSG